MANPTYEELVAQQGVSQGFDMDEIKKFLTSLNIPELSTSGVVPYGDLAARTNQFMTEQAKAPYVANLPGYQNMLEQATGNTYSQLQGMVPTDVTNLIQTQKAEKGIGQGGQAFGQAPSTNAAYLHDLGLTSIGQQKEGMAGLHQLIGDTPVPQLFNPASLFVPEHLSALELAAMLAARQKNNPVVPGTGTGRGGGGGGAAPGGGFGQQGPVGGPTGGSGYGGPGGLNPFGTNPAQKNINIAAGRQPWDSGGGLWDKLGYDPRYFDLSYDTFGIQPPQNIPDFSGWLNSFGMGLGTDTGQFTPFSGMLDQPNWDFYNQASGGTTPDYWNTSMGSNYGLPAGGGSGNYGLSIFGGDLGSWFTGTGGGWGDQMGGFGSDFGGSLYDVGGGSRVGGGFTQREMDDLYNVIYPGSGEYDNTPIFNDVGGSWQGGNLISGGGGYGGGSDYGGGGGGGSSADWWWDVLP